MQDVKMTGTAYLLMTGTDGHQILDALEVTTRGHDCTLVQVLSAGLAELTHRWSLCANAKFAEPS